MKPFPRDPGPRPDDETRPDPDSAKPPFREDDVQTLPEGGYQVAAAPSTWKAGQVILDDYTIVEHLGSGGMGAVYLVRSESTGSRYAVKRVLPALVRDAGRRRDFLRELHTWCELPAYPHLAGFRFFRTMDDEFLIFSEYVKGGSLRDFIGTARLIDLETILDVAIQIAMGLSVAHRFTVVHQDVKPGNVLLTGQGVAKITDFGLARARAAVSQTEKGGINATGRPASPRQSAANQPIEVSYGGLTPAYCSPEQASRLPLTPQTDIWSWGVCILEMFNGGVTWLTGVSAMSVLERLIADGPSNPNMPDLPLSVAEMLRRCFQKDPAMRWRSIEDAAEELRFIYRDVTGEDYPRDFPPSPSPSESLAGRHERKLPTGGRWDDPAIWLSRAAGAAKIPVAQSSMARSAGCRSRMAQDIADLTLFEDARQLYLELLRQGRRDLIPDLAGLCKQQAYVHWNLGDLAGSLSLYDQAISLWETAIAADPSPAHMDELAKSWGNKALALWSLGDFAKAIDHYEQCVEIWEKLIAADRSASIRANLGRAYLNRAIAVWNMSRDRETLKLFDPGIRLFEELAVDEGDRQFVPRLAGAYMNKANVLRQLGELDPCLALHDRAIELLQQLARDRDPQDLTPQLAKAYINKAGVMIASENYHAALDLYDQAIGLWRRLIDQQARLELRPHLARALNSKGLNLSRLERPLEAIDIHEQAIELWRALVYNEGRREFSADLAESFENLAEARQAANDPRRAVSLFDQSIVLWRGLVLQDSRPRLVDALANAYRRQAMLLLELKNLPMAEARIRQALEIFTRIDPAGDAMRYAIDVSRLECCLALILHEAGHDGRAKTEYRNALDRLNRYPKWKTHPHGRSLHAWINERLEPILRD